MSWLRTLLITLAVAWAMPAGAEQMQQKGPYQIHYQALPSTFLTPQVARQYQLTRSNSLGLVNIAVLDSRKPGTPGIKATVTGTARNLLGNSLTLNFREIKDGPAVYYIASVPFRNEEQFQFQLTITAANGEHYPLTFSHKFYQD